MKDFDIARSQRSIRPAAERTFKLGGEIFVRRASVPAEVMVRLDEINSGTSAGKVITVISDVIGEMCEAGAIEKWAALRARKADEDPLTMPDCIAVLNWLIEEETAIPTSEPSPSGDGSGNPASGDPSTVPAHSEASIHSISPSADSFALPTPG